MMEKSEIFICLFATALAQIVDNDYDDEDIILPEEATGRPAPPELVAIFGNKTGRDQDLEVCMGELLDCHQMKHEIHKKVCGRHSSTRKTFEDMCELNYENCKTSVLEVGMDDTGGLTQMRPITVDPDEMLWEFAHEGGCSTEVL